jgi:hypothetical protein
MGGCSQRLSASTDDSGRTSFAVEIEKVLARREGAATTLGRQTSPHAISSSICLPPERTPTPC